MQSAVDEKASIVPVEKGNGPATGAGSPWGVNNELLPQRLQTALGRLVQQFGEESESTRRDEIRRIKQAHQFWRGLQYLWWSEQDQNWHLPFEQKLMDQSSLEDMPRYEYVTNIYQAFGLSIIAVLSQDVPRVRFFPQSAQAEEDIGTAKAATEVGQLIERNNRMGSRIVDEAYQLWTGGKVGAYVRYVVDGQRFGFHPEVELTARAVPVSEEIYRCGGCGAEIPIQEMRTAQQASLGDHVPDANESEDVEPAAGFDVETPSFSNGEASRICPKCGIALDEGMFVPAEVVTAPGVARRQQVPNGQEVITIVGALELKTPPWANEMHDYPYLQWNMEVHLSRLRAAYPHAADRIGIPVAPAMNEYERLARLAQSQGGPLTEGGDINMNLITFQRTWLRPWAFYSLDDKKLRDELLAIFPDGCYVAFAGDTYCESRNESMDEHWRVLHAMPGDGSSGRPALGDALISVQERFNTLSNLQIETYEYGIPPIYADSEVLDFDALQSQTAEPGAHYPARAKSGLPLAAGFFQPAPAQVPPDLAQHAADLMGPVAQFLTGAFPALFGGAMSANDTAAGYSMARDQAMGRIGLVWRKMKYFHADVMLLAVDCFRKNRPNDVEVTLLGAGAAFESKWIRLSDLKGNLFTYPESDEQFPTMWAQQRAVLMQLLGSPDPQIQQMLAHPENLELIKRLIGLEELVLPDEESRTKQYREIAQLLAEQPVVVRVPRPAATIAVGTDGQNPIASGAVQGTSNAAQEAGADGAIGGQHDESLVSEEVMLPSVVPDGFTDNHQVELETCRRWFASDSGQVAKIENPAGYANVRAHAVIHQKFLSQQVAQAAVTAAALKPSKR